MDEQDRLIGATFLWLVRILAAGLVLSLLAGLVHPMGLPAGLLVTLGIYAVAILVFTFRLSSAASRES